jgi:hypothetical protein
MFFSRNKSVQIILFPVKSLGINQIGTLKHRDNAGVLYICIFIISIIQFVQVLVLSATLNNISAISWLLVLLVEKTELGSTLTVILHEQTTNISGQI